MHPTYQLRALYVAVILYSFWTQTAAATLQLNTNPAVKEFGAAATALVLCYDKTVYALSYSPTSLAHISAKNINYVKVETLNPGYHGGVDAEITGGAIKKPNIVITLTEGGRRLIFKSNHRSIFAKVIRKKVIPQCNQNGTCLLPFRDSVAHDSPLSYYTAMARCCCLLLVGFLLIGLQAGNGYLLNTSRDLVVQFGTYDVAHQQCFYQRLYSGMISPQSVTFNNPAAKAIKYVIVESDQEIAPGGISASITSGTVGDSNAITVQVNTSPQSIKFLNNVEIRMFCMK
uniref:Uncharacterized protein n=1 Tax=Anopheles minimus TaxID=112268 RepID=A0A182WIE6_9DIPT